MHALVTGGAGFIGSTIADRLINDGHSVRILDDLTTGFRENVNEAADLFVADIGDADAVRSAVEGSDVVFHLAAHRAVARSVDHPLQTDRANTFGTLAVLDAARHAGVRRVVYSSSSSVYGGAETRPSPESTPTLPRSPYAVTKLAGEHYARVYAELFGLETVALRYFNVYGPRQRPDSAYAAVIPLFIEALRQGDPAPVHGDGLQSRDFTYIDDVVNANLAAASAPAGACSGKAYNIAGGAEHSLVDLLEILGQLLSVEPRREHQPPRAGDVRHTRADISAAERDLGHKPAVDFEEGLRRTLAWDAARRGLT